jgi:hypothetical protein
MYHGRVIKVASLGKSLAKGFRRMFIIRPSHLVYSDQLVELNLLRVMLSLVNNTSRSIRSRTGIAAHSQNLVIIAQSSYGYQASVIS